MAEIVQKKPEGVRFADENWTQIVSTIFNNTGPVRLCDGPVEVEDRRELERADVCHFRWSGAP